jgi:hypothetical protein
MRETMTPVKFVALPSACITPIWTWLEALTFRLPSEAPHFLRTSRSHARRRLFGSLFLLVSYSWDAARLNLRRHHSNLADTQSPYNRTVLLREVLWSSSAQERCRLSEICRSPVGPQRPKVRLARSRWRCLETML